ncbi:MAG TPA: dihydroxyacetone kinase subunit DhaL [bacterium]|nr:dihydroxyacetone kinase subunit DhaL [bacterium]
MSELTRKDFVAALNRMVTAFEEAKDSLCRMDSIIGDGDHGISMVRGFRAVAEKLPAVQERDIATISGMVGSSLIGGIGGVTGPIFGTVFARLAVQAEGKEQLTVADLAQALRAALDGIRAIGHAEVGDKTMVDALAPTTEALEQAAKEGLDMRSALERASRAAEEGARSTINMRATKGRARYLGGRSIGHQDPGATSFAFIIKALSVSYQAEYRTHESETVPAKTARSGG